MENFPAKLTKKLTDREAVNALRTLREPQVLVDFCSNDYLGLARNEGVYSWAGQLLSETGQPHNGATGSRLLTGNHVLNHSLEAYLEQRFGAPALVFNSGYDANLGFFSSVPQRGDVVLYDERVHASIRDGIRLGQAKAYKFSHNNLDALQRMAIQHRAALNTVAGGKEDRAEVYVVTESVFSMDGDSPDLAGLAALCREHGCRLVVDEAHAIGVCGPEGNGLLQAYGLHKEAFARILTFGKALGAHGAAIVGSMELRTFLLNFARSFIYTTALPPHALATLLAAFYYTATPGGRDTLQQLCANIGFFTETLASLGLQPCFTPSRSAIHCCQLPGNSVVREASEHLREKGFDVRPILSPTVPEGSERLRFCLHSYNSKEEILAVLEVLKQLVKGA